MHHRRTSIDRNKRPVIFWWMAIPSPSVCGTLVCLSRPCRPAYNPNKPHDNTKLAASLSLSSVHIFDPCGGRQQQQQPENGRRRSPFIFPFAFISFQSRCSTLSTTPVTWSRRHHHHLYSFIFLFQYYFSTHHFLQMDTPFYSPTHTSSPLFDIGTKFELLDDDNSKSECVVISMIVPTFPPTG